MSKMQTLTLNGSDYILVPVADYEEMTDLLAAYRQKLAIDRGEETWPAKVVEQLVAGIHPVKVFRTYRGLTMKQLAEQSGVSQPFLSMLEQGNRNLAFDTASKLADVLAVDLKDLRAQ